MKHVLKVTTAGGKTHLYLRKAGLPRIRLTSPWPPEGGEKGSALEKEVERLIEALTPGKALPGTLKGALKAYELESQAFRNLADSTKAIYRLYMSQLEEDLGHLPVQAFTPAFLSNLMDEWSKRGHRAANHSRQVLLNALRPAMVAGLSDRATFALVGPVARPRALAEPHILWSWETFEAIMRGALAQRRFGLARAIAIGRYIGARRGDLIRLPRTARVPVRSPANGLRFQFLSGKRRVRVDVPEDPALTEWLDETPSAQPKTRYRKTVQETTTLVYSMEGTVYTESGLGQAMADLAKALHAAGKIDSPRYDLHGLRHTKGVEMALAGCTDAEIAAALGHASPSSAAQYRRQADRIRLADSGSAKVEDYRARNSMAKSEHAANAK